MTLHQYLDAVHRFTGVSEVESFWMHSAVLAGEVFCLVALMAWTFLHISRSLEAIEIRAVRATASWALMAVYCLVLITSMLLFFEHEQIRRNFDKPYAHVAAALGFFLVGWSPMLYIYWRKERLNPNGA